MPVIKFKYRFLLFVLSLFFLFLVYFLLIAGKKNPDVYVILRYDDYASASSLLIEKEIIKSIHENNFSCSFAIIPYSLDSSFAETPKLVSLDSMKVQLIKKEVQTSRIEICQHGYLHKALVDKEPYSEFRGMEAKEQFDKISSAKDFLEKTFGQKITTFVPPWNTYDHNTLKALDDLGFENISADQGATNLPDVQMKYLPFSAYLPDVAKLMQFQSLPGNGSATVVVLMLHDYDFREVNPDHGITDLSEFKTLICGMIDRHWNIVSVHEAVNKHDIFSFNNYKWNGLKMQLLDHLDLLSGFNPVLQKLDTLNYIYLSGGKVTLLFAMVLLYYFIVLLIVSELVYQTIGRLLFKKKSKSIFLIAGITLLVILVAAFLIDDQILSKNEGLALTFLLGCLSSIYYKSYELST